MRPAASAPPPEPQQEVVSESQTTSEVSVATILTSVGTALSNFRQALRNTQEDKVATLISHSLDGVKQIIDAAVNNLPPEPAQQMVYDASDSTQPETVLSGSPASRREMVPTQNEMEQALSIIRTVLCDVRETLLELNEDDIDELAQATLIVANISMGYATSAHKQIADTLGVPEAAVQQQQPADESNNTKQHDKRGKQRAQPAIGVSPPSTAATSTTSSTGANTKVIWEPLGPQLWHHACLLSDKGKQQPIAALAIATTCWPAATCALCCIAPPLLATDAVIQWGKGTPVGQKVEQTAAEALEVAKLWYLVGKISVKQSIRFAKKEFKRTGGVQGLINAGTGIISNPVGSVKSGLAYSQVAATGIYNNAMWLKGVLSQDRKQD